jgi:Abortive infection alpha
MTDPSDIIKSGAMDTIADLTKRLAGPLVDELGMMLGDRMKVYRTKNWVAVVQKTSKILEAAHIPAKAVPPRLFLPILDSCSMESEEALQDLWAGLLGSASEDPDAISPSFFETLKQLKPSEARTLSALFDRVVKIEGPRDPIFDGVDKHGEPMEYIDFSAHFVDEALERSAIETFERLGVIRRQYELDASDESRVSSIYHAWVFTEYGRSLVLACSGPEPVASTSGNAT